MKLIVLFIMLLFICVNANAEVWQPSPDHTQIPIWPKGKNTGATVIVFPGGGFHGLAIDNACVVCTNASVT